MTGSINLRISALREANEPHSHASEAGYHLNTAAEAFQFRQMHNSNDDEHREPMNDDDGLALMTLIKAGDFDAKQNLITRNLRVVLKRNRRYANKGKGFLTCSEQATWGLSMRWKILKRKAGSVFLTTPPGAYAGISSMSS